MKDRFFNSPPDNETFETIIKFPYFSFQCVLLRCLLQYPVVESAKIVKVYVVNSVQIYLPFNSSKSQTGKAATAVTFLSLCDIRKLMLDEFITPPCRLFTLLVFILVLLYSCFWRFHDKTDFFLHAIEFGTYSQTLNIPATVA